MRNHPATRRYRATDELRRRIVDQGRRQDWLAEQVGISAAFLSNVLAGRRTIGEVEARVICGLIGGSFSLLFELSNGISVRATEQPAGAVA